MGMPSFYKIMKDDYTKKIQIPHSFLKHFKGVLPQECILRNPVGRSWVIKLVEVDRCLFFSDSWGKFVQDQSLEWGDFIMFTYEGNFEFHVNVFEKSGCEMDYAVASKNRPGKVGENVSNNSSGNGNRTNEAASSNLKSKTLFRQEMEDDLVVEVLGDVAEPNKKNVTVIPESLGSHIQRDGNRTNQAANSNLKGKTLFRQETNNDLIVEVLDVVAEPKKENGIVISQSLGSRKQRIKTPTNEAAHASSLAQQRDNRAVHRDLQPKKVGVIQKEKAHSSRNISFSVTMRPSYISPRAYLHVPTQFSRSYFAQNMEEVVLLVSGGKVNRRWKVNYFSNNSAFAGGWSTFARDNDLKVDDVCYFEAVVPRMVKTLNVVIHRKS